MYQWAPERNKKGEFEKFPAIAVLWIIKHVPSWWTIPGLKGILYIMSQAEALAAQPDFLPTGYLYGTGLCKEPDFWAWAREKDRRDFALHSTLPSRVQKGKKVNIATVSENGSFLQFLGSKWRQDESVCRAALTHTPSAIKFVDPKMIEQNPDFETWATQLSEKKSRPSPR